MKIGIDARFFGPESKGLGRYTQKLIENLEKIDESNEYIIFLRKDNYDLYKPKNKNFKKVLADYKWYTWKEQLFFYFKIRKQKCDFVHFPHFNVPLLYKDKFVVTIHDLILFKFPTNKNSTRNALLYKLKYFVYKKVISHAVKNSSHIITVSNFTKNDIIEHYFNLDKSKISVIYEAGAKKKPLNISEIEQRSILKKNGIDGSYILYVGNAYPHKNLNMLVDTFDYWQKKYANIDSMKLVLVGRDDYFYKNLANYINKNSIKNIKILHTVDDDFLDILYRNAHVFVFPSLYEGFGLPPLEACGYGVPVLSSAESCMPEILGDSVVYTNVKNKEIFAKDLNRIMTDINLRKDTINKCTKVADRFSWEKTARDTYRIYSNLI